VSETTATHSSSGDPLFDSEAAAVAGFYAEAHEGEHPEPM